MALSPQQREDLVRLVAELERRKNYKFRRYFPDCLPGCIPDSMQNADHVDPETGQQRFCRALYRKHVAYMAAGIEHRERLFLAANRIGKTETAAYEITAHMTGLYPPWWTGKRFDHPVRVWAAGDTMVSTRDVLQVAMLGPVETLDTQQWAGMLPAHLVHHVSRKTGGVSKCVDQIWVTHISGKTSSLEFKSYDQGRRTFQGTELEIIWVDEEPPDDVYSECLTRTITAESGGMIIATFTPLQGLTPFIQQYLQTAVMLDTDGAEHAAYHVFYPEGS